MLYSATEILIVCNPYRPDKGITHMRKKVAHRKYLIKRWHPNIYTPRLEQSSLYIKKNATVTHHRKYILV